MTQNELNHLMGFLSVLSERLGDDGCNDLDLPNTPENLEMCKNMQALSEEPHERSYYVDGDKICLFNFVLLSYLRRQLSKDYPETVPVDFSKQF